MTIPLKPINTNGYSDFVIFDRTKHYGRVNFDYYFLFYLTIYLTKIQLQIIERIFCK